MSKRRPSFYASALLSDQQADLERYLSEDLDQDVSPPHSAAPSTARRLRAEEAVVLRLAIIAALYVVRRRYTGAAADAELPRTLRRLLAALENALATSGPAT